MKNKNVTINIKVIPVRKTVRGWGTLSHSVEWKNAKQMDQEYLFVSGWKESENAWILSASPSEQMSGDFFKASDFILFNE